jgi:UDP-N-acetylmuramyl pentapeptide phosphotransferase/UDP-N-acetylglucosamine-1-phosphate transferase
MLWVIGVFSALVAYAVTRLSISLSLRGGVMDVPNVRSSHSLPVPRLGGIGILIAAVLSVALLAGLKKLDLVDYSVVTREVLVLLGAGLAMALTGLCDDLYGLRVGPKFLLQFAISGTVVAFGYRIESVELAGWGPLALGLAAVPVSVLWLTGFANIFNFMDGINGLSALTAAAHFLFFFVFAQSLGVPELAALAWVFAGGCIGFLPHNFPSARTFMGDTGSLLLGITIAFYVIRLAQRSPEPAFLVALLLVCSVYLWDGGFTLVRRLRCGENIFRAHRGHLYQRLVRLGQSHARITLLYFALHLLMGCLAVVFMRSGDTLRVGILGLAILTLVTFTVSVHRLERRVAKS